MLITAWPDLLRARSLKMANEIIENFNEKLRGAVFLLPEPVIESDRREALNIFLDGLIGSVCICITEVTKDTSARMEDAVVANIRAKFVALRKQNLGVEVVEEKVPIEEVT